VLEIKKRQIALKFKFLLKLRLRHMGKCHTTIFSQSVALEGKRVQIHAVCRREGWRECRKDSLWLAGKS